MAGGKKNAGVCGCIEKINSENKSKGLRVDMVPNGPDPSHGIPQIGLLNKAGEPATRFKKPVRVAAKFCPWCAIELKVAEPAPVSAPAPAAKRAPVRGKVSAPAKPKRAAAPPMPPKRAARVKSQQPATKRGRKPAASAEPKPKESAVA